MVDILHDKCWPFDTSVGFNSKIQTTVASIYIIASWKTITRAVNVHTAHVRTAAVKTLQRLCPCSSFCRAWLQITSVSCTAANTSDRCVFTRCDKIFFGNKVVFSTRSGFQQQQWGGRLSWRSKASKWRWRGRRRKGILSVTICRWRSRRSGLGFWFWAERSVYAAGFSSGVRSCPGWGGRPLLLCSPSCTEAPSCRTP